MTKPVKLKARAVVTNMAERAEPYVDAMQKAHRERLDRAIEKFGPVMSHVMNELANLLNISKVLARCGEGTLALQVGECITALTHEVLKLQPQLNPKEVQDEVLAMAHGLSYVRDKDSKPN